MEMVRSVMGLIYRIAHCEIGCRLNFVLENHE